MDFKAVGQTMSLPMAIAVHPSLPTKSFKELIALARASRIDLHARLEPRGLEHRAAWPYAVRSKLDST